MAEFRFFSPLMFGLIIVYRWWMEQCFSRCLWWSLRSTITCVMTVIVWRPRISGEPWYKSDKRSALSNLPQIGGKVRIIYNYYNNYTPTVCKNNAASRVKSAWWILQLLIEQKLKYLYMYMYLMNQNLFFHFRLITRRPFSSWNSWSWSTKLTPTQLISKLSTVGILCEYTAPFKGLTYTKECFMIKFDCFLPFMWK